MNHKSKDLHSLWDTLLIAQRTRTLPEQLHTAAPVPSNRVSLSWYIRPLCPQRHVTIDVTPKLIAPFDSCTVYAARPHALANGESMTRGISTQSVHCTLQTLYLGGTVCPCSLCI